MYALRLSPFTKAPNIIFSLHLDVIAYTVARLQHVLRSRAGAPDLVVRGIKADEIPDPASEVGRNRFDQMMVSAMLASPI